MTISPSVHESEVSSSPIDAAEEVAESRGWSFERLSDDEISIVRTGGWCDYQTWLVWRSDIGALHISCAFDIRVPEARIAALYPLLGKLNERLWIGHFELWTEESRPAYRYTLLAQEGGVIGPGLIEDLVEDAMSECERFYPAIQLLVWGGKDADEAIEAALLETVGEA